MFRNLGTISLFKVHNTAGGKSIMTKGNRIVAAVLAVIAVVVMLSSALFIVNHADHDCIGEDCPVCEQLDSCAQNLRNLSVALLAAASVVALAFSLCGGIKRLSPVCAPCTPVLLKVKLSN